MFAMRFRFSLLVYAWFATLSVARVSHRVAPVAVQDEHGQLISLLDGVRSRTAHLRLFVRVSSDAFKLDLRVDLARRTHILSVLPAPFSDRLRVSSHTMPRRALTAKHMHNHELCFLGCLGSERRLSVLWLREKRDSVVCHRQLVHRRVRSY